MTRGRRNGHETAAAGWAGRTHAATRATAGALLVLATTVAVGSDHIDGPVTMKHRVADLTDVYAFPTPGHRGWLTVVLNTYPIVPANGHYDEKVSYVVTVRRATIEIAGEVAGFATSDRDELTLQWTFDTPRSHDQHKATCSTSAKSVVTVGFNDVGEAATPDGLRLYAGMRSDPFFFNSEWAKAMSLEQRRPPPADRNVMAGMNVLSLVMEIDMKAVFPGHSLFAIAAESFAREGDNPLGRHLDRVGRPEITNVSLVAHGREPDLRDRYNLDRAFHVPPENRTAYVERLMRNVAAYDTIDGTVDWTEDLKSRACALLVADFLVVDVDKPVDASSFLEIERSLLAGRPHVTCGGRALDADVMDDLFTLYVAGPDGTRIRDGVDGPAKPLSPDFPYLADPDLSIGSRARSFLARQALGL